MTVMTLALLAAVFGAWLVWRMFLPLEINYNEAWNGWLAQAAMGRGPLYPDADALTVNNYPPLSFYIVGALAQVLHLSPVFVGRVGSLLGLAATSGAAAGSGAWRPSSGSASDRRRSMSRRCSRSR